MWKDLQGMPSTKEKKVKLVRMHMHMPFMSRVSESLHYIL